MLAVEPADDGRIDRMTKKSVRGEAKSQTARSYCHSYLVVCVLLHAISHQNQKRCLLPSLRAAPVGYVVLSTFTDAAPIVDVLVLLV